MACGAELPSDSRFCSACGAVVPQAGGDANEVARVAPADEPTQAPQAPSSSGRRARWPLIVGAAVIGVVLLAGIAYLAISAGGGARSAAGDAKRPVWMVWVDMRNSYVDGSATADKQETDIYAFNTTTREEKAVCTAAGYQADPATSGDWVVWADARDDANGNGTLDPAESDIYAYNLKTNEERPICTANSSQVSPSISGDWVVWSDARDDKDGDPTDADYDIYAYNMKTGEERAVCTSPGGQTAPRVSGDWVVWEDVHGDATNDIYAYNLSSREERAVCTARGRQTQPEIDGDWVVWADASDDLNGDGIADEDEFDIHAYNLRSAEEKTVCSASAGQMDPDISGDLVVWSDGRGAGDNYADGLSDESDIYAYELKSGEERPISTGSANQLAPSVSGGWIAWVDSRNQAMNEDKSYDDTDIYAWDLEKKTETAISKATGAQWGVSLSVD